MPPDEEHLSRAKPQDDGLGSYRQLIELQKQMIELSQQHEQSKRDCAVLREQVAREVTNRSRPRRTWRRLVQQSAGKWLKRVPGLGSSELKINLLNNKEVSSC